MRSTRTSYAPHLQFRKHVLGRDKAAGVTNCPLCGVELNWDKGMQPNSAEPDHIVPIAQGGTNHPDNGRAICRRCNQSLGGKLGAPKPRSQRPLKPSAGW